MRMRNVLLASTAIGVAAPVTLPPTSAGQPILLRSCRRAARDRGGALPYSSGSVVNRSG
jgi:hypothetical protein